MGSQTQGKLNWLQHTLPEGLVVDSGWLERHGISRQLRRKYVMRGWLLQLARGVYCRSPLPNETTSVPWQQLVISLNALQNLRRARVDEHQALAALPVLERGQQDLIEAHGRLDNTYRVRVPCRQPIRAIGVETMPCIEEDELVVGTKRADLVKEIMLQTGPRRVLIRPELDVPGRNLHLLDENICGAAVGFDLKPTFSEARSRC